MDGVQSINRAGDIIDYIGSCDNGATLSEVMVAVALSKTTAHRILKTLLNKGFLDFSRETGRYQIGIKFFVLSRRFEPYDALLALISPVAKRLHNRFDEAINVSMLYGWTEHGYQSVIVHKEQDYNRMLSANPLIGKTNDCHSSAVGKCLLAFSDKVDMNNYQGVILRQHTENTITDYETLLETVRQASKQGYAIDDEEQEKNLYCIGVPVLMKNGKAIAAMSIAGRKSDILARHPDEIIAELLEVSQEMRETLPNSLEKLFS